MIPGKHDFQVRRGDTERVGAFLNLRDLRSQEVVPADLAGSLLTWTFKLPGGPLAKTSAPGGGLAVDTRYAFIRWEMSAADTRALPVGAHPYTLVEQAADGRVSTYLIGRLVVSE